MSATMQYMIGMALTMQAEMDAMQEDWKERILKQWEESKKMPRKKKKKIRKELLLEWSIANYDPFNGIRL
jgi:hypothetical protein